MAKEKSLAKNSIYYLIYNVLNVLFPFLTGIYVARVLLPETVGAVEYARNIASYFVILAFLGIPTYGIREAAKCRNDKEKLNRLFSELFIINLLSTIIFLSIYLGLVFSVSRFREEYVLYLVAGLAIAINALNFSWLFEGLEEFKFISLRSILFKAVSFLLLVLFVRDSGDYLIYALITVVGTAGNYILNVAFAGKFVRFTKRGLAFKRHLKPIFFLVVVNLAIELYSLVDVTMIGIFCEEENVAYYSYAVKIQRIFLQIVNTFTMVLVPRISHYYKEGQLEEVNALLSKTLNIIVLLALPMILGLFFVSEFIVVLLYGKAYLASAGVLKILSLALLISPIGYLLGSRVLLITDNENKMVIAVGSGALANVVGNAILIPLFSETGAAIASILSEIIVMAIYLLLSRKYYRLNKLLPNALKIILAAGLMAAAVFAVTLLPVGEVWRFVLQVLSGVVVYFLSLLLMKEKSVIGVKDKLFRRVKHE